LNFRSTELAPSNFNGKESPCGRYSSNEED
jgi:hypothetical protein